MINLVIRWLALATLVSDIFIIALLLLFIGKKLNLVNFYSRLKKSLIPYSYYLTLLVSVIATLGSLFFSEIAKFEPCKLCWFQRIFMYPQPLLLYLALAKKQTRIITTYIILLSLTGLFIATYHYLLQVFPSNFLATCSVDSGVSCTKNYRFHFGYITIPMMSWTAFTLNIIFLSFYAESRHRSKRGSVTKS